MRYLAAALLACALAAPAQEPAAGEAAPALKTALETGGEEERVAAIRAHGRVPDPEVVALLAKAVRDPKRAVRREAIEALGWNPSPRALEELTATYWKNTLLRDDDELFALLLKAIGRHGDPSSVIVLADHPFRNLTLASGTARIMGLGNIRAKESVKRLVEASKRAGGERRKGADDWPQTYGPAFRTALTVLTGEDLGTSRTAWQTWWRDHEATFKVLPERPSVPAEVAQHFERYWDMPYGAGAEAPAFSTDASPYGAVAKPSREEAEEAARDLRDAFGGKQPEEVVAAIQRNARYDDPEIVRLVAKGLSSKSLPVQLAAIDALGWMPGRDALRQLHRLYHRDRSLPDREEAFAALLKAIGRHGDPSSVDVLSDSPFRGLTVDAGRARILGLGNIRHRKALEELVKGLRLAGDSRRMSREPVFMEDFRLAFAVLTGADVGASREEMDAWWRDHRKDFRMSPDRPPLPPQLTERWARYWGTPY
jgi:HEAT repeat protein